MHAEPSNSHNSSIQNRFQQPVDFSTWRFDFFPAAVYDPPLAIDPAGHNLPLNRTEGVAQSVEQRTFNP